MNKLFGMEDFNEVIQTQVEPQDVFNNVQQEVEEIESDLGIATERLKTASNEFNLVSSISSSLKSKKLASIDYFTSMENYRPTLEAISRNLGMKNKVPSLEDFQNPHGTQASHDVAMEGFFDYMKKIWDKIKEIFSAFFKKISVFFRRLFNAELELDTYEEYVEGMIAKIKAKKLTVSDNKAVIDTKLPTLLANAGMEAVDSDFILTTGESKIRQLVSVANTTFHSTLNRVAKEELKDLYKVLKDVVDSALHVDRPVGEIAAELDKIRDASKAGLTQLFSHSVNSLHAVPDSVYEAIHYNFDRNEIDDLSIHSLVDNGNYSEALPKNFNAFYILSESGKLYVAASTESNGYVQNKLHPISNTNNLVRFYEFYRKISKELNLKKIDSSIGEFQDRVDDIVGLMKGKYVELLERLQKNKVGAREGERIGTKEEAVKALVAHFVQLDKLFPNNTDVNQKLAQVCGDVGIDFALLENLINGQDLDTSYHGILNSVHDEADFVARTKAALAGGDSTSGQHAYTTREELEQVVKEYEAFQKFLLNYLNSLQAMLKEVSVNLAGTFTELRFEMVKYIYNSAKLYT